MLILIALAVLSARIINIYYCKVKWMHLKLVASKAKGRVIERHIERGDDVKADVDDHLR